MSVGAETYRPLFVSQRDEDVLDECAISSGLMLLQKATLGEIVRRPDGREMGVAGLQRLRDAARRSLGPQKASGGLYVEDVQEALHSVVPALPRLREYFGRWDELWSLLMGTTGCALWGNPSHVKDKATRLARWFEHDDYGHVIYVDRADGDRARVMDPLGFGRYYGEWIPREELRQFAFVRNGSLVCLVAKAGEHTAASLIGSRLGKRIERMDAQVSRLEADLEAFRQADEDQLRAEFERGWDWALEAVGSAVDDLKENPDPQPV